MSNRNKHISYQAAAGWMDISVPPDMEAEFKMLVRRATSTWQDMSPEMRDFADRVLGVESIMGQNMKAGHSSNNIRAEDWKGICNTIVAVNELSNTHLATRSCCGTLLREPHMTECPERAVIRQRSKSA